MGADMQSKMACRHCGALFRDRAKDKWWLTEDDCGCRRPQITHKPTKVKDQMMTDRFNALTVVLETDLREDDAEALMSAIRQLRGVVSVTGNVTDTSTHIAEERVRHEMFQKLLKVLRP